MHSKRSNLINFLIKTCDKVSNAITRDFYELEKLQVSKKDLGRFVTNADVKAEKIIIRELSHFFPDSNFLLEERGEIINDPEFNYRWIVDAIDGTSNFMRGNPHVCISIALEMTNTEKEIIAGIVYCPITRDIYWSEKGKGAYYIDNLHAERKIKVSSREKLSESVGTVSSILGSYSTEEERIYLLLKEQKARFRITGSTALDMAYVASGRFDFCVHDVIKLWDIAAGILLIREAGGVVSDFKSNHTIEEGNGMIGANPILYNLMV
ncbi:MAG: inositol monophosphatase [Candidatus Midichloria sp.]|nr:inositol monophosphatase [Candidatus Midichloria sp.]